MVVGDGIVKDNLKKLVAELEIEEKVLFLGKILPPDLMELYRVGDLFVTASETETQGIVLIEAAATGLPIVAVDAGAVKEICQNGKNGVLCHPGDIKGLTKGIVKILTDKKLRTAYGKKSVEIAKKHDINRTLNRFEEIYKEAIRLKNRE